MSDNTSSELKSSFFLYIFFSLLHEIRNAECIYHIFLIIIAAPMYVKVTVFDIKFLHKLLAVKWLAYITMILLFLVDVRIFVSKLLKNFTTTVTHWYAINWDGLSCSLHADYCYKTLIVSMKNVSNLPVQEINISINAQRESNILVARTSFML